MDSCKLTRKESYKAQRKNYRMEKKRVANELLSSFKDPTVIVMSDWLKIRGTLKSWTKLWCILKPGLLLIYKSPKTKVRMSIIFFTCVLFDYFCSLYYRIIHASVDRAIIGWERYYLTRVKL